MRVLGIRHSTTKSVVGFLFVALMATTAVAQDMTPLPPIQQPTPPPAAMPSQAPQPKAPAKTAAAKTTATPAGGASVGGDAALRQRVEQLEEQLIDMQVVIGTLESLAKTSGSTAASPQAVRNANAPGGADSSRVSSLEAQVQALSQKVQQLQSGNTGAIALPPSGQMPQSQPQVPPQVSTGFGSTTVTPDSQDPIGGLIANAPPAAVDGGARPQALPPVTGAAGTPEGAVPGAQGEAKQIYETAYGSLLNQNYTAAQSGFQDFLRRFPKDTLAPDALFWLGESHYMQRNYADAAEAFDLVASAYGASAKAPEAQLRRATTLVQLGRKDDACAALRTLNSKYPNARAVLKTKADAERQRAGCV